MDKFKKVVVALLVVAGIAGIGFAGYIFWIVAHIP